MKKKNIFILAIVFFGCTKVIDSDPMVGCMDETAFNYDSIAELEGDCQYADERIYVSTQGFDQVNILNILEGEIQEKQNIISVNFIENMMDTPHFVEIDEINNLWFVTLINSGNVLMYDLNTNIMLDSILVGDSPALMTHDANQKKLYISRMMPMMEMPESESNKIQVLDYSNQEFVKITDFEIPAPAPHGLDISDNGKFLFVASNTSDWVFKIDTESGEIINSINLLDPSLEIPLEAIITKYYKPIQLKYYDNNIFISCSSGEWSNPSSNVPNDFIPGNIMALNADNLEIIDTLQFGSYSSPWHIAIDQENYDFFVALAGIGNTGSAGITHFSFENNEFTHHWTATGTDFSLCHGVAISKKYNQVYLSGRGNGILHSINKDDGSILQSINVLRDVDNHDHGGHSSHGAMLGGIAVH